MVGILANQGVKRRDLTKGLRKTRGKSHTAFIKLILKQLIAAALLFISLLIVKSIDYPITNIITENVRFSLSEDINKKELLNNFEDYISRINIKIFPGNSENVAEKGKSDVKTETAPVSSRNAIHENASKEPVKLPIQSPVAIISDAAYYPYNDIGVVSIEPSNIDTAAFFTNIIPIIKVNPPVKNNPIVLIGGGSSYPANPSVIIDPGHGGVDPGTSMDGLLEKDITLIISKKLQSYFKAEKYNAILTRTIDTSVDKFPAGSNYSEADDLKARVNIINNSKAELYLCIHVNSNPDSKDNGSIVYYNENSPISKILAYNIQKDLNSIKIGQKPRSANKALAETFYILKNSKIPGVLIETAYITNQQERLLLAQDSFKSKLAHAIYKGVIDSGY